MSSPPKAGDDILIKLGFTCKNEDAVISNCEDSRRVSRVSHAGARDGNPLATAALA